MERAARFDAQAADFLFSQGDQHVRDATVYAFQFALTFPGCRLQAICRRQNRIEALAERFRSRDQFRRRFYRGGTKFKSVYNHGN
jgi:hypothetical protein